MTMFQTRRRVEFRDTDAAGIVHFSAFFPMMEAAEHEMLRSLGVAVLPKRESGESPLTWPRVSASCDYQAAARFEDWLDIEVQVAHIGRTSVRHEFHFRCGGKPVATGQLTVVCCRLEPGGNLTKTEIPAETRRLLMNHH